MSYAIIIVLMFNVQGNISAPYVSVYPHPLTNFFKLTRYKLDKAYKYIAKRLQKKLDLV
jgi:hypothetical protein